MILKKYHVEYFTNFTICVAMVCWSPRRFYLWWYLFHFLPTRPGLCWVCAAWLTLNEGSQRLGQLKTFHILTSTWKGGNGQNPPLVRWFLHWNLNVNGYFCSHPWPLQRFVSWRHILGEQHNLELPKFTQAPLVPSALRCFRYSHGI